MSTQPNKSSTEADPATGPGANGSTPKPADSAAPKPTADHTRPEGIAPISDQPPPWDSSGSSGPSGSVVPASSAGAPSGFAPTGPPSSGGPSAPSAPSGPPGSPGGGSFGSFGPGAPVMQPAVPPPPGSSGGTSTKAKAKAKKAVARLGGSGGKSPRRAQLQLSRLEPWSVMKFSFVMSLVAFIVLLVAVVVLYTILSGLGVFSSLTDTINDVTGEGASGDGSANAGAWFSFGRIFGYTVLVGALNVLLITALSTVGSVIYNIAADLVGGIEVTLKEAE